MGEARWRHIAALRLSRTEMYMLLPILLGVGVLAFFAHPIVVFLGIRLLVVLIAFLAVQVDLDKEGVIGRGFIHAQQMMARLNDPSERAAHRSEMQSHARPLLIAKIISAALVIVAVAGFFYLD